MSNADWANPGGSAQTQPAAPSRTDPPAALTPQVTDADVPVGDSVIDKSVGFTNIDREGLAPPVDDGEDVGTAARLRKRSNEVDVNVLKTTVRHIKSLQGCLRVTAYLRLLARNASFRPRGDILGNRRPCKFRGD